MWSLFYDGCGRPFAPQFAAAAQGGAAAGRGGPLTAAATIGQRGCVLLPSVPRGGERGGREGIAAAVGTGTAAAGAVGRARGYVSDRAAASKPVHPAAALVPFVRIGWNGGGACHGRRRRYFPLCHGHL